MVSEFFTDDESSVDITADAVPELNRFSPVA
jgi:hypothetical protein